MVTVPCDRIAGQLVDKHWLSDVARPAVDKLDPWRLRTKMFGSPYKKSEQHRRKVTAARRQSIFVAWGAFAVAMPFEQSDIYEMDKPPGEHVRCNTEGLVEIVEPGRAGHSVAQEQDVPPPPDLFDGSFDRAVGVADAHLIGHYPILRDRAQSESLHKLHPLSAITVVPSCHARAATKQFLANGLVSAQPATLRAPNWKRRV